MKEELDYSPGAKPLYAQLHDILLGKLKAGEYKKNDVLPTEAEFEEIFGVSVSLPVVRSPSWPPKGW
ncbi:hypothetical protein RZS00_20990 [Klebsiella pneumoniae]|nr:hypothetical protein [Klebsiella pneumoniae]